MQIPEDKWIELSDPAYGARTYKMKVPNGWLYRSVINPGSNPEMVIIFVPE